MAILIMRLKLFLTPQLALLTALITTLPKVTENSISFYFFHKKYCLVNVYLSHSQVTWFGRRHGQLWLLVMLVVAFSVKGVHNLRTQWVGAKV